MYFTFTFQIVIAFDCSKGWLRLRKCYTILIVDCNFQYKEVTKVEGHFSSTSLTSREAYINCRFISKSRFLTSNVFIKCPISNFLFIFNMDLTIHSIFHLSCCISSSHTIIAEIISRICQEDYSAFSMKLDVALLPCRCFFYNSGFLWLTV